jgi:hypothetical protein
MERKWQEKLLTFLSNLVLSGYVNEWYTPECRLLPRNNTSAAVLCLALLNEARVERALNEM